MKLNKHHKQLLESQINTAINKVLEQNGLSVLTESEDRLYRDLDDDGKISLLSEDDVIAYMKGKYVNAYNPQAKGGSDPKDWALYAVRVSDIKSGTCCYLGRNEGWPDYWSSTMTLYGTVSFIKTGNGQQWEFDFPGKVVIEYDIRQHRFTFTPYKYEGKAEDLSRGSRIGMDSFTHFAHRSVVVPYESKEREIGCSDKKGKSLVEELASGYRSYYAVKHLIKYGYLEIKDGELVAKKKENK